MSNLIGNITKEGDSYFFNIIGRTIDNNQNRYMPEPDNQKMSYGSRYKMIENILPGAVDNEYDVFCWEKDLFSIKDGVKVQFSNLKKINSLYPVFALEEDSRRIIVLNDKKICYFNPSAFNRRVLNQEKYYLNSSKEKKLWGLFTSKPQKEVNEYALPELKIKHSKESNVYYLPEITTKEIKKIDCSSNEQLKDWFVKEFKCSLEEFMRRNENQDDLFNVRWHRLKSLIDEFNYQSEELADIYRNNQTSNFCKRVNEVVKPLIKKEYIQELRESDSTIKEFEEKKEELLRSIDSLQEKKESLKKNSDDLNDDIQRKKLENEREIVEMRNEFDAQKEQLENERICLENEIENLKTRLAEKTNELSQKEEKYKIAIEGIKQKYSDLFSNMEVLLHSETCSSTKKTTYFHPYERQNNTSNIDLDYQDYNSACIIPSICIPYAWANILPHCRVYTIHVEHDWLHYSDFIDHGLLDIWNESFDNANIQYILILDSLNITRPECGLKPLLDLINKKVPQLLGSKREGFPNNLKIMATLLKNEDDGGVALELNEDFFKNWEWYEFRDGESSCSLQSLNKPRLKLVKKT